MSSSSGSVCEADSLSTYTPSSSVSPRFVQLQVPTVVGKVSRPDDLMTQYLCEKHKFGLVGRTETSCPHCLLEQRYEECPSCGHWNPKRLNDPWPCQWPRCERHRYMSSSFGPKVRCNRLIGKGVLRACRSRVDYRYGGSAMVVTHG